MRNHFPAYLLNRFLGCIEFLAERLTGAGQQPRNGTGITQPRRPMVSMRTNILWTCSSSGHILIWHCSGGVNGMGSTLRYCRAVSVRALLVPALLALAWLVWGAGSAQASTDPSKAVVSESALDLGLSKAPPLPAAQVLRAGQDPAGSAAHHVAAASDAVVGRATPAVSTVARTTEPVALPVPRAAAPAVSTVTKTAPPAVSAVSPAAASVAATVNRTVAPAVSTVHHAVAAVDGPVASVAHRLPRLPLPAVKPPQLPSPDVPVATVRKTPPAVVPTVRDHPLRTPGGPSLAIGPGRFIRTGPQQFPQPRKLPALLRLRRSPAQQPRPPPPRTWRRSKTLIRRSRHSPS
jgi:hypothetical protein